MTTTLALNVTPAAPVAGEVITVDLVVAGAATSASISLTGQATLPSGAVVPGSGSFTLGTTYELGTVAGYDVEQDPAHPSRFTLTPSASS